MRKRRIVGSVVVLAIAGAAAGWWKYERWAVGESAEAAAKKQRYEVEIYRPGWFGSRALVFDIVGTEQGARRIDAIHALVAAAEKLVDTDFAEVVLARDGEERFKLHGGYIRKIGEERSYQNPVYTVRKFPQHVRRLDGSQPWPAYSGGVLGVLGEEMEDVNEVLEEWLR